MHEAKCIFDYLPSRGFFKRVLRADHATGDANKLTQEEWQSRVNATRERVEQRREELRLEREKRYGPKPDELRR